MAETVVLVAKDRSGRGSHGAKKLRQQGLIPGVVYGHKEATVSVALPHDELFKAVKAGARVIDLKQGEKLQKALIRDLQWDYLGKDILHVDFARVSADERITLDVRVELRGTAAGAAAGGVIDQPLHNLVVECPVISVPESIRVNIAELQIGVAIHVRELTLPPGVVVKNDPDAIVVQMVQKQVEAEPTVAAVPAATELAEPEVITKKKEVPEEEPEK
ncbi:MAG: 50S ribosomal protein L25 [Planctomycetes bacterium]|nr:50S ribosomal protein L25 [Planctomycetota bacterium]